MVDKIAFIFLVSIAAVFFLGCGVEMKKESHDQKQIFSKRQAEIILKSVQESAIKKNSKICEIVEESSREQDLLNMLLAARPDDILQFGRPMDIQDNNVIEIFLRVASREDMRLGLLVYLRDGRCEKFSLSRVLF